MANSKKVKKNIKLHSIKPRNYPFITILGDLILSVNNQPLHGVTHQEAINVFKGIKTGLVEMIVGRSQANAGV